MISEKKIDKIFPLGQFKISRFNIPFRLDHHSSGEGIMLFILEDLPAKLIDSKKTSDRKFLCRN